MKASCWWMLVGLTTWLLAAGCGGRGPSQYAVHGTVTYRGKPVPTGNVMFVPESGVAAAASIGSDGTYRLMAAAGKHRVVVTAVPVPPPGANPTNYKPPAPLVPPKFGRPETSGLVVEVGSNRQNEIDLTLQ